MKSVLVFLMVCGFSVSSLASFWAYDCSTSDGSIVIKRGQTESGVFLNTVSYKEVSPDKWERVLESKTYDLYGGGFGNEPQTAPEAADLAGYPDGVGYVVAETILTPVSESRFSPPQCAAGEEPQGTVGYTQVIDVREISFTVKGNPFLANEFPYADSNGVVKAKFICEYSFDGLAMSCIK